MSSLQTNIGRLSLKNPVITASGTFGYGMEYADLLDLSLLGGMVLKGSTLNPREGNPYPRMAETPAGMLNAVGLQNKGVRVLVEEILPPLVKYMQGLENSNNATEKEESTRIIINLSGSTKEEYVEGAAILDQSQDVSGVELNISCPNVKQGGMAFGTNPAAAAEVVAAVRKAYRGPLLVKLSPNVTDVVSIAKAVEDAGADGIALINTLLGMEVDIETQKPLLSTITGGLSGPCIRPVALRMVWQVAHSVKIPVVGMGGITNARDALAFFMVGASAVEVGTANFENPAVCKDIINGIKEYMDRKKIDNITSLIGII